VAHAIRIEIGESDSAAVRTTHWISTFYPDVAVGLEDRSVRLESDDHDEARLRLIWLTSLANERLLARGATERTAVFAALVQ
jgi:hypothetical protein